MNLPLVSIIIPAFNIEKYIGMSIVSCIEQNYDNIEIIIVNDGSTDKTPDVIKKHAQIDSRIVYLNKKNEGVNLARRDGVIKAKGEYLFFLDGDDTIPKDSINKMIEIAILNDSDIVAGDVEIDNGKGFSSSRSYSKFKAGGGIDFLEFILSNSLHYLWGKLIRRSIYTENRIIQPDNIAIGEDQIQLYQICYFAQRVDTVNTVVYNYLYNESSVTQRFDKGVYSHNQFNYSSGIKLIQSEYGFNSIINQQLNLRLIISYHQTIGRVGDRFDDYLNMRKIVLPALKTNIKDFKWLFSSKMHIVKGVFSLILPAVYYKLRLMFQSLKQ